MSWEDAIELLERTLDDDDLEAVLTALEHRALSLAQLRLRETIDATFEIALEELERRATSEGGSD